MRCCMKRLENSSSADIMYSNEKIFYEEKLEAYNDIGLHSAS